MSSKRKHNHNATGEAECLEKKLIMRQTNSVSALIYSISFFFLLVPLFLSITLQFWFWIAHSHVSNHSL